MIGQYLEGKYFLFQEDKKKTNHLNGLGTGQLDWKVFNHLVLTTNIKPLSNYLIDNDSFGLKMKAKL